MNLYEALSEEYDSRGPGYDPPEPAESGRDWCMVVAESSSKARSIAAKHFGYGRDPQGWPKLSVRKVNSVLIHVQPSGDGTFRGAIADPRDECELAMLCDCLIREELNPDAELESPCPT